MHTLELRSSVAHHIVISLIDHVYLMFVWLLKEGSALTSLFLVLYHSGRLGIPILGDPNPVQGDHYTYRTLQTA